MDAEDTSDHVFPSTLSDAAIRPKAALERLRKMDKYKTDSHEPLQTLEESATVTNISHSNLVKLEWTLYVRTIKRTVEEVPLSEEIDIIEVPEAPSEMRSHSFSGAISAENKQCGECDGKGEVDCYSCEGEGLVSCPETRCRNGRLSERCVCVNGKIEKKCTHCKDGSRHSNKPSRSTPVKKTCQFCDGTGIIYETCPQCSGNLSIPLGQCNICTRSLPLGKIECEECVTPAHTSACTSCEGVGVTNHVMYESHLFEKKKHTYIKKINTGSILQKNKRQYTGFEDSPSSTQYADETPSEVTLSVPPNVEIEKIKINVYKPLNYILTYTVGDRSYRAEVTSDSVTAPAVPLQKKQQGDTQPEQGQDKKEPQTDKDCTTDENQTQPSREGYKKPTDYKKYHEADPSNHIQVVRVSQLCIKSILESGEVRDSTINECLKGSHECLLEAEKTLRIIKLGAASSGDWKSVRNHLEEVRAMITELREQDEHVMWPIDHMGSMKEYYEGTYKPKFFALEPLLEETVVELDQ